MSSGLHPTTARRLELLRTAAQLRGIPFVVTSGFRSIEEQARLFQRRQLSPTLQRYPVAVPGTSTHNYGLAIDVVSKNPRQQRALTTLAQQIGFVWAGPKDPVHLQVVAQDVWSRWIRNL